MRYLVYLLILTNLAFFAWYQATPVAKPRPAQPAPLPPGVDQLMLLSERGDTEPVEAVDQPQAIEAQASTIVVEPEPEPEPEPKTEHTTPVIPAPPPERICQTIGPLPDKNIAAAISAQLYKQGYKPDVRGGEVREPAGYWVYMPSMPAREARRIVKDLDEKGMKDYFIGKGSHISLGIFSSQSKARARQKRIKKLGYIAKLDQRYRTRTVYWLDVEEHEQALLGRTFWQKIQAQHPDIRVQQVSCE